jgi:biotin synthase
VQYDEVIARVKKGDDKNQFERMCISMISHPDSNDDTFILLEKWVREVPQIPVSILSNPTTLHYDDMVRMRGLEADIFTVALDAVTPAIFDRTRGKGVDSPHKWDKYRRTLEWAAEIYGPEKFGAHLEYVGWVRPNRKFLRWRRGFATWADTITCSRFSPSAVR